MAESTLSFQVPIIFTVHACSVFLLQTYITLHPTIPLNILLQLYEVYGSKTSTWRRSLIEINLEYDAYLRLEFKSVVSEASGRIAIDDISIEGTACKYG